MIPFGSYDFAPAAASDSSSSSSSAPTLVRWLAWLAWLARLTTAAAAERMMLPTITSWKANEYATQPNTALSSFYIHHYYFYSLMGLNAAREEKAGAAPQRLTAST